MKLIQEYIIKICIAVFILALLMELYILFLLMKRAPKTFDSTYHQTMEKSESKSIEITGKIEKFISNLLMKYTTDLKLIGKHASLLNGKAIYSPEKLININSNMLNINNNKKMILKSNTEELKKNNLTKKYYNNLSDSFEYILNYEIEFKNNENNNIIINSLFSDSHQELNSISYYSLSNNDKIFTQEEKIRIKFIISIFKTIFIRRYIAKRNNADYIHFYIINNDEIFIYPPESYNKTLLYNFDKQSITSGCNFTSSNINQKFPLCVYNSIIRNYENNNNYVTIVNEKIHYENMFSSLCLKFPFIINKPNQAILCIEMDISKTFNNLHFGDSQKFEFGVFSFSQNNTIPLIYGRKNMYNEIKNIFSDFEIEKYKIEKNKDVSLYSLFHFLYYNITQLMKNHSELNINIKDIEEEFNAINNRIIHEIQEYKKLKEVDKFTFTFNKTICRKALLGNFYECLKDEFEMIIFPLLFNISNLNDDFLEIKTDVIEENFDFYIYSIISTNPYINNQKINLILKIKIERTIILFIFLTMIIICFLIFFINLMSEYSLSPINTIILELKNAELDNDMNNYNILTKDIIFSTNKEVSELKQIYESMRKVLIIKQVFDKEKYLDNHNMEFFNLINKIKNKDIKEICNSFIGFYHFKNESYNLADNEFRETLLYIQDNENKIIAGKNNEFDDKIKDAIKRSSTVSYINEYSIFEKIDENVLDIIQIRILKQRFIYLYAMTKYKLGCEYNNNNQNLGANNNTVATNKNKSKKNKDKKNNYLKDSIKYFTECKNINISLGINQIKVIYSLIMISKCYMELNDYKNSIINISEALNSFFELSKTFKEYHSKYYNPKVMLFVENNIFHFILYNIQRLCFIFKKPYASNWIILKIFETSPFLITNVHFHSGLFIQNFLDKTKSKLGTSEVRNINSFFKEFELTKQYFGKITQRMNIKNISTKKYISNKEIMIGDSNYSTSNKNKTETKTHKSNISSLFKKDMPIGRMINSFHTKNKNINKIITLCVSEKVLKKINGPELKDVIIKYFQKFFTMNENDKFSYIQFANNGKKTIYFKMENLDYFIQKIQKTKSTFEVSDLYVSNSNIPFMELYNIFDSILKNYPPQDDILTDNIIFMFINSDDIRFTSEKECMNIVKEINKKNASVFLLSYDKEINQEKINNIQSFLNGLFEGYFFQIKNYQHIKQIFTNISTNKYQSNFFGYDFGNIDHEL